MGGTCEWLSSPLRMEGDPSRCGGDAEDIDLILRSCTDHLEVQTRRQPGQRCRTRSHPHDEFLLSYCRAVAVLSVKMRGNCWHIPVTVPSLREAAIHKVLGLVQVVRAEVPLAAFTPALGVQHNFSSKSFLIRAGIWCLQTSATAKSSVLGSECRVSASAV